MIDFAVLLQKVREEKGSCQVPMSVYATIRAKRTDCRTGKERFGNVHWICEERGTGSERRFVLTLLNGVTGYESWYLDDLIWDIENRPQTSEWSCACAGTANRWDRLDLDCQQFNGIVKDLAKCHAIVAN